MISFYNSKHSKIYLLLFFILASFLFSLDISYDENLIAYSAQNLFAKINYDDVLNGNFIVEVSKDLEDSNIIKVPINFKSDDFDEEYYFFRDNIFYKSKVNGFFSATETNEWRRFYTPIKDEQTVVLNVPRDDLTGKSYLTIGTYFCKWQSGDWLCSWKYFNLNYNLEELESFNKNLLNLNSKQIWKSSNDDWDVVYCHENTKYDGSKICDWPEAQDLTGTDCSDYELGLIVKTSYEVGDNFECVNNENYSELNIEIEENYNELDVEIEEMDMDNLPNIK
ncbi:hypothetical protein HOK68_04090 [Candidatus Woesearchaeota archaeon]|jgi:hypothetical protein|nr:hypothetical protein [Candidatus Woesearchaeota archaeon]MBT4387310.1 hypothetical protein [Candidatus Woesearchaeota archaeon]MBT4595449.1 hypothetical protein [Candidatus Woesearchaeota archaeon]MBT5741164.1 hypothetical protein [Candidatus Woesearchaeota archaeon]MBT6505930.1 hypothetical protein [Candidatus Woesearchaeota archaeon]